MARTEKQNEALRQLRRVVEMAPDDLLHMRSVVEKSGCGTARCAFGWCLVDPWFMTNTALKEFVSWDSSYLPPPYKDETWRVFGLSAADSINLFASDLASFSGAHSVSKAEVLWNIDRALEGEKTLPYRAVLAGGESVPVSGISE